MFSPETIAVIKATVPVLVEHGETLTRHFYKRMFAGDPEVLALFNPAHQHAGTQQRALAAAICAYAQNIENPAALGGAVELIAQKHVALRILPRHYPIVGKHLLGSIREVLGAAATDDIINAWAAAYGFLADVLIAREAEIYAEQEREHGWAGFRPFKVVRKQPESDVITSFYLAPVDGGAVRPFKPGQYVTVRVPTPHGHTTMRNYSLSGTPGDEHFRISVKREPARNADAPRGYVSHFLHEEVNAGDMIEVGPPCGEFTLHAASDDAERPLVLLSGGVGITPVLSMLRAAVKRGGARPILFVHAALHGGTHAFRQEVRDIAARHPNVRVHFTYSEPKPIDRERNRFHAEGYVDAALLGSLLDGPDADFFLCGPKPFMTGVYNALRALDVKASDIHYEFFGPLQNLAAQPRQRDAEGDEALVGAA